MPLIGPSQRALVRAAPGVSLQALISGDAARAVQSALSELPPPSRAHALTPNVVFTLVLGLGLWREKSVPEVLNQVLAPWGIRDPVTDGALAHARRRLGSAPLRRFFESVARAPGPEALFHGRRLRALDGVRVHVPDTPRNAREFGRPHCEHRGRPRPQLLAMTLCDAFTHRIRAASIHPCRTGERAPGLALLEGLGAGDLVLMDRGFHSARMLLDMQAMGIEYVVRMPDSVRPKVVRRRGPGDYDVEIRTHYRRERPRRAGRRRWARRSEDLELRARMIEYRVGGARAPARLLTNVADVEAQDLAEGFHLRWEAELGYDEIKSHLAAPRHAAQDLPVRGKSPELVEQEVWALLALYNLIRDAMAEAAASLGADPRSLGFTKSVELVRGAASWTRRRSRRGLAQVRRALLLQMAACRMRRWRRKRRCPRAVRERWNPFPGKKRHQHAVPDEYRVRLVDGRAA